MDVGLVVDVDWLADHRTDPNASEAYLVLKKLGYPRVSVYSPGWQEWGNRDDTPAETP